MLNFLKQPYPAPEKGPHYIKVALAAGFFVGLFLSVFQPFGAYEWDSPYKIPFLAGYGLVTFLLLVCSSYALPWLAPTLFKEQNWTVGKEILHIFWHILSIACGNYLYGVLLFGSAGNSSSVLSNFVSMLLVTLLIGLFPAAGITLYSYFQKLRKYSHPPQPQPISAIQQVADAEQIITLVAENERDSVSFKASALLFIESADNYSEIVFLKNNTVQKELIRSSLSRLENQLSVDFVVRCHRSYLVNLHKVVSVSGNAQGYKFHLDGWQEPIPVARKYSELVTNGSMKLL